MRSFSFISLLIGIIFLQGCGGPPPIVLSLEVKDQMSEQGVDSASVLLYRIFDPESANQVIIDSTMSDAQGLAAFAFEAEAGYIYRVQATKQFYQEAIAPEGGLFLNEIELSDADTQTYTLWLEPILAPEPDRFEKMHTEVSIQDVIHTLKTDSWEWAFLPRMQWGDIPALLSIGDDSTYAHLYPRHPQTRYQPDSVRIGLVALWLVEAIRRQQIRQEEFAYLMPPSRAPVLGTRRGNPSGFNSIRQIQIAKDAYESWWKKAVESGDTLKTARMNPLRGKGMSWM